MDNLNMKSKVVSSLIWKLMERGGTQGVQFLVQIILARLLTPNDYGIIALVTIFVTFANVFVQSGFGTALIQKKDADHVDFSSVFYISLLISLITYVLIYVSSPYIADFYNEEQLIPVLRVLSITLIFGSFNSVQTAYLLKNMQFKKLFFSSLGAIIISGVFGIIAAFNDLGVWALVVQQLSNQIAITVIMWYTVEWRPTMVYSTHKVKKLFSYGSKLLAASLLETLFLNIQSLIIGRLYNPAMLGYYNRGYQFPAVIVSNINGSIQSVMLPALSIEQDDKQRVMNMVRRSIVTSSFIIFPMMFGLAVVAEPLVLIVLTEKWLPAVPFLQIACMSYALYPIHTANLQAINALGRSDIFLKLEIIKKALSVIILLFSIPFGVYAIALGQVLSGILSSFINAYPNKKLLDYGYKEQYTDIMPAFFLSFIMSVIIYTVSFLRINEWNLLALQIIIGIFFYIYIAKCFKIESYEYLKKAINQVLSSKTANKN